MTEQQLLEAAEAAYEAQRLSYGGMHNGVKVKAFVDLTIAEVDALVAAVEAVEDYIAALEV